MINGVGREGGKGKIALSQIAEFFIKHGRERGRDGNGGDNRERRTIRREPIRDENLARSGRILQFRSTRRNSFVVESREFPFKGGTAPRPPLGRTEQYDTKMSAVSG